jgi:uncharacterized protein YndB with AHSA1/START domain
MRQTAEARVEIAAAPERVFDAAVDVANLPRIMKKVTPIPGVMGVEMEGERRRKVRMSDGSVMEEEITVLERPGAYRYRWLSPPAAPFNLLVRTAESAFQFSAAGGGTRIDWVYTFELTSPLALPLAWPVIRLFRRWMVAALAELKAICEAAR